MSDPKLKPEQVVERIMVAPTLRLRRLDDTGKYVPWQTAPPREGESVRWQCVDGRWVTIELGHGDDSGRALVCNDAGEREYVDGFDAALALAKKWRTV